MYSKSEIESCRTIAAVESSKDKLPPCVGRYESQPVAILSLFVQNTVDSQPKLVVLHPTMDNRGHIEVN